jgi:uncharacterized protein
MSNPLNTIHNRMNHNQPNALIHANSPYLLQHAYNPVAWEEWSDATWQRAKSENKLVLVSIGYSTCHWCHVMEHESFEDFETAEIMNHHLINIKVDREERPDIDMVYMDACQIMTGRGGWPLNVVCLPNMQPIYAGTYFPKEQWQQIIEQLAKVYREEPEKANDYAQRIQEKLDSINQWQSGDTISRNQLKEQFITMAENLDWVDGGPNRAPKFPLPGQYEFILDYHLLTGDESAKDFLHLSLIKMSNGGIYDTIRGGFCRYSTDAQWFAPHFEKMLYDNAQLISLYSRAFAWSDAPLYKQIAEECIQFCEAELGLKGDPNHTHAGYGSALDADSEGMEGKFYVFTREELLTILNDEEFALAEIQFNIQQDGNWEHGYNILHQPLAPLQVLEKSGLTAAQYHPLLLSIKQKIKRYQDSRVRPSFDDKAICSWNALYLKALADAGLFLDNSTYLDKATALADWLWSTFWQNDSLLRIHRNGETKIHGFLEDYACLCDGLLSLHRASPNPKYIVMANALLTKAIELFYDPQTQQMAFTPKNGEALIVRKSDLNDDVIASPNSILAHCLFQVGMLQSNQEFIQLANTLLLQVSSPMIQSPGWYFNWSRLAQSITLGGCHIKIDGGNRQNLKPLYQHLPSWTTLEYNENNAEMQIMVCCNNTCFPPVNNMAQALEIAIDCCALSEA